VIFRLADQGKMPVNRVQEVDDLPLVTIARAAIDNSFKIGMPVGMACKKYCGTFEFGPMPPAPSERRRQQDRFHISNSNHSRTQTGKNSVVQATLFRPDCCAKQRALSRQLALSDRRAGPRGDGLS
jgi:hypothetical protein